MNHPHLFNTSSKPQKTKKLFLKEIKNSHSPPRPKRKENSIRLGYWIRPMVSCHVSVDIPFHHHHCNRISSTAIGEWEQATSRIHRGWTRVFMFFQVLEFRTAVAFGARAGVWSAYEATREGAGEQQPRSSLALLVHRVAGPACSRRPDHGSGDGPQQPRESRAGTWCYLPAIISNTGFSWEKGKILESHEIGELAGVLSLSTVFFFKKELLFVAKVAIIPERISSNLAIILHKKI